MVIRAQTSGSAPAIWQPHLLAMVLGLAYAWCISQTAFVKTGVQFISPLLVIMSVHLVWILASRSLQRGYAQTVLFRSLISGLALAVLVPLIEMVSPMPSHANSDLSSTFAGLLAVLFCLAVLVRAICDDVNSHALILRNSRRQCLEGWAARTMLSAPASRHCPALPSRSSA